MGHTMMSLISEEGYFTQQNTQHTQQNTQQKKVYSNIHSPKLCVFCTIKMVWKRLSRKRDLPEVFSKGCFPREG